MNDIHPSAVIEGDVRLGSGNVIGPNVVIYGPVTIGDGNWIGAGVVIGAPPEVRSFDHPRPGSGDSSGAGVRIGDRNVIREYAQVHQGWKRATVIGHDAFIMNQVYVAHDCSLDDGVTLASSVLLAGHVHVGALANLGLGTTVHQGRYIGRGAMVGMSSVVTRDIPPFAKAYGSPARVASANAVGLRRMDVPEDEITTLVDAYESGADPDALPEFGPMSGIASAFVEWRAHLVRNE
ncbi:acyl-ACP--UDP-N- acetylglucosamine O-acyltransferase [Agromyces mariniharenae]|uniref:Acyl-ACP--UDP-N-acetylglucosamine O-acyltransferase n=1 Tax=Agromyces mariniharenae TaxID=2604423 RepID=A0A5S4V3B4_9MICO|nr:acyl-ACP--UDP-N- acetylglucosamine O-acyltransferase [Agromyces mariniharenae]TYL52509.1 acyl-ACP--UDP-N- acetylglucosamine O-acyltransferase [Agromyces mariniharenae]